MIFTGESVWAGADGAVAGEVFTAGSSVEARVFGTLAQ